GGRRAVRASAGGGPRASVPGRRARRAPAFPGARPSRRLRRRRLGGARRPACRRRAGQRACRRRRRGRGARSCGPGARSMTPSPAEPADAFAALRPRLFGIAYRLTGSVSDAEDICQEAWLRWHAVDHGRVTTPEAYLVRTVTHLGIDRLRSAQHRKETYVGPYLPEPLVADRSGDPEAAAELSDSLTLAFLVLLDELAPVERAVLL